MNPWSFVQILEECNVRLRFTKSFRFGFRAFPRSLTAVIQSLPPEMKKQLHEIRKRYFAQYGMEGLLQRLNNRTVAQIFAEYQPRDLRPLASGEVDDVRFELYDPARPDTVDGES